MDAMVLIERALQFVLSPKSAFPSSSMFNALGCRSTCYGTLNRRPKLNTADPNDPMSARPPSLT